MKCWRSVFSLLLVLPSSEAKFTTSLLSNESTSEKPAVQENGWRMNIVVPFYKGLAVGLATGTSLAMVLSVGFSVWLSKRGWSLAFSGGTSGDGKKTQRRHSGLHGDCLELMPCAPLPPEPSDNDRLAVRVPHSSGAEYSEPNFPPEYLEPISGPYDSLRMAEVGVPSVYSSVR